MVIWKSLTSYSMSNYVSTFKQFEELELLKASFTSQSFKPHFHEQFALVLLEKGRVDYSYKDQQRKAESGTLMLLNPYEVHTGKSIDDQPWDFRSMYISQQLFNEVFQEITAANYVPYFSQNMIREEKLLLHYQQLHEYLLDETDPALMKMALTSLIRELIQVCELTPSQPESDEQRKAILLKEYIHEHYLENIRLDVLGEEMGLSKYYLIRLFESVYGLSPIRYAINLRIEEAKRLLYQGMKYTEVAYSTGFYDQSHFIRHFKKIVGVTPKAFC